MPTSCTSLDNQLFFSFFYKFGTAGYEIIDRLFVLLIYSAGWTGVILYNSFIVSREVVILSCSYQSLHLSSQSCTSETLFGFANVSVCFSYFFWHILSVILCHSTASILYTFGLLPFRSAFLFHHKF